MSNEGYQSLNEKGFIKYLEDKLSGKTVALLGNSPNLLLKDQGKYIDEHDIVIRFNDARTEGHEAQTGKKTNVRFFGANMRDRHLEFLKTLPEESILITPYENLEKLDKINLDVTGLRFSVHRGSLRLMDTLLDTSLCLSKQKSPRSGLALLAYLSLPQVGVEKLSIFGMERVYRDKGAEHYFGDGRVMEKLLENYDKWHMSLPEEIELFNSMINNMNVIEFN
jgi:hypothetical protein